MQKIALENRLADVIGSTRNPRLLWTSTHGAVIELTGTQRKRIEGVEGWEGLVLVQAKLKGGRFKFQVYGFLIVHKKGVC